MTANEVGDAQTSIGIIRDKKPTEVLGPCIVSIGSPLVTHIKFEASKVLESVYKTNYVYYSMRLYNGKKQIGHIGICQHAQPYTFSPVIELRDHLEPQWKGILSGAFTREIFNGAGAVTIGTGLKNSYNAQRASFMYKIDDFTGLNGFIQLSEEEAIELINSIHAELRESQHLKMQKYLLGDDLVQKLKQLKEARDADLISEDEYQQKRQTILSKM